MLHRHKTQPASRSRKRPDPIAFTELASPSRMARDLLREVIRLRAYELYLARDDTAGNPLDDWLQAEREYLGVGSLSEPVPIAPSRRGLNGESAR